MAKSTSPIRAATGWCCSRRDADGPSCVFCIAPPGRLVLPKGKLDPGENTVEAARRETIEEILRRRARHAAGDPAIPGGISRQDCALLGRLGTSGVPGFLPNKEIDELRWFWRRHRDAQLPTTTASCATPGARRRTRWSSQAHRRHATVGLLGGGGRGATSDVVGEWQPQSGVRSSTPSVSGKVVPRTLCAVWTRFDRSPTPPHATIARETASQRRRFSPRPPRN